ncbi:MAG: hypothetical protein SFU99_02960 [Saprospiraceae bacterium]|nr:hypothetical protein [Saprospiraceae bacterium]
MEKNLNLFLPLSFEQVLALVKQLSVAEQEELLAVLQKSKQPEDAIRTHFASEKVLAKDWLNEKEDEAWQDL